MTLILGVNLVRSNKLTHLKRSKVLPAEWTPNDLLSGRLLVLSPDLHTLDVHNLPTAKLAVGEGKGLPPKQLLLANGTHILRTNFPLGAWLVM